METLGEYLDGAVVHGRQIRISNRHAPNRRRTDAVHINFVNLPPSVVGGGGGAEAENNRMSFWVEGFDREDEHAPPPTGKVKVEMATSALPRDYKLRAKTGTPERIAQYLADFLNKVAREVPPKFTHSTPR